VAAELRSTTRPTPAELASLLDGIATSIVWLDEAGAVVHLNEPAEDLFGVGRNQALGQPRTRRRDQPRARRRCAVLAA
jgi:PAS domain-containing protein